MDLHIFNPEHDIALACNRNRFTPPHAAQELRMNLGWIAALWAADGDAVLVDDVAFAVKAAARFRGSKADVCFVSDTDIQGVKFDSVKPWGWDNAITTRLADIDVCSADMPSDNVLEHIRLLSSRIQTQRALRVLREGIEPFTCGEAFSAKNTEQVDKWLAEKDRIVLKAPWSSSGRGVRYVMRQATPSVSGFMKNVIYEQGSIMVEPYYNKVKDFGMEFEAMPDGSVKYRGLSLFMTRNGAYTGNILACEEDKTAMLSRYIPTEFLLDVQSRVCHYFENLFKNNYCGPFGVDMMVVASEGNGGGFLLHPCVEINLRRTMGHVALAITPGQSVAMSMMHIDHDVNYVLRVSPLENPFVKVI
ncbi:MAG: hypothetical protein SOZ80_03000 [Prevotella sp.]|uniref:hypothetical protein n=1 Tax=Prevotella sp. TaxID=59823 RepID=UPI002A341C63|nr:hypothetical protein [Prevotella sp.]MDD7318263.1 hypothetical protein [Prevotellaceae bacterium]MDY4019733.1 hypothetical protein [Prevotella sp.]